MTYELMDEILTEMGLPYTYYQFSGDNLPAGDKYIAYFESEKVRFLADDKVFHYTPTFAIELYTKYKEPNTEKQLIDLLDQYEVVWSGGESTWIESEQMFQTVFYC